MGLVHRDLKLENVMIEHIEPLSVRIIDFGSVCEIDKLVKKSQYNYYGTTVFKAPEALRQENEKISEK